MPRGARRARLPRPWGREWRRAPLDGPGCARRSARYTGERRAPARAPRERRSIRRKASPANYGASSPSSNRLDLDGTPRNTSPMEERELIYDWNGANGGASFDWTRARVDLNDETLRDGLQSPSVTDPSLDVKKRLLHLMADLGIVAADIGLPGAGPGVVDQVRALATEIRDHKLPIMPNCAARTVVADVVPIVRVVDELGIKIEAATFIGSSPIRQYAEDWTLDHILKASAEAVTYAVSHGLPVMYVTEDTTRARPETLKALYGAAIACGA